MKQFLLTFIIFGVFAYCYGQNIGSQAGGEIVWNDDINLDEIGSAPIISISSDTPQYPMHMGIMEGAGGAVSTHDTGKSSSQGNTGSSEKTKLLRVGGTIDLDCKIAQDISDQNVLWYKNNELIIISEDNPHYKLLKNATLEIEDAIREDVGEYRCETVGSTPSKSDNISVVYIVLNKPFPKSTMVVEGEKLNLTCDVEGDPMPIVSWLKDNMTLEESINQSRYTLGPSFAGTERASFIIPVADYEDRALYACFIKTGDLQYNTTTFVRVKDMYAALWPFLGICAEVFILCLIIFIYEKRRAKADFEESDTDQPPEQKNTSEQNKDTVRHRK